MFAAFNNCLAAMPFFEPTYAVDYSVNSRASGKWTFSLTNDYGGVFILSAIYSNARMQQVSFSYLRRTETGLHDVSELANNI